MSLLGHSLRRQNHTAFKSFDTKGRDFLRARRLFNRSFVDTADAGCTNTCTKRGCPSHWHAWIPSNWDLGDDDLANKSKIREKAEYAYSFLGI